MGWSFGRTPFLIAGPCVIEPGDVLPRVAEVLARLEHDLGIPVCLKASFDKANRARLGAYTARLRPGSRVAQAYGTSEISERHRHRWEVSNAYRDVLAEYGLRLSGQSPDGGLVEVIELPDHVWFIGCQFHPELKSRPTRPHPLFAGFIAAALRRRAAAPARAAAEELARSTR